MIDRLFQQFVLFLNLLNFLVKLAAEFHLLTLQSINGVPG